MIGIADDIADELHEARIDALAERQHDRELTRHPSCADPGHPGCWRCEEE
ncbi:hypothetical protein [Guyparkeria halopsychrophila]